MKNYNDNSDVATGMIPDSVCISGQLINEYNNGWAVDGVYPMPGDSITVEDYLKGLDHTSSIETVKEDITLTGKETKGKAQLHLVPPQIMFDCAEVREYAVTHKYKDPNNWKKVDVMNYIDASLRHLLKMLDDPTSLDEEDKIEHYKHLACNVSFICHLLKEETEKK